MMSGVRTVLTLLALACASCSDASLLFVPAPEMVADAQTLIMHIADADGDSAVVGAPDAVALELGVSRWQGQVPAQVTLTLAYYDLPASQLGLSLGPLAELTAQETRACALSAPIGIAQTTLNGGTPGDWQDRLQNLPERMASYIGATEACAKPSRCLRTEATTVPIPGSAVISSLLRLDAQHVLAGDHRGRYWRVRKDGFVQALPALTGLPGRSATQHANGEFWFGGNRGRIAHGPLEGPFETQTVSTASAAIVSSVRFDPETGEGLAVVVSNIVEAPGYERVELYRHTPPDWTPIANIQSQEVRSTFSRVRWLTTANALVVYGGPTLLHYDGRDVRDQVVGGANPFFDLEIRDATMHPQHGAAIVADDGRLYLGGPPYDTWVSPDEALLGVEAGAVLPLGDGFLIGGNVGRVKQFYPGAAECSDESLVASDADVMLQLGGDVVVSGKPRTGAESSSLTWISFFGR